MKVMIVAAGAVALVGCAINLHHPSNTLAEQKLDKMKCKEEAEIRSVPEKPFAPLVRECLAAKGYVSS